MYAWLLAGIVLGMLLGELIRRFPSSILAEMSYVTIRAAVSDWRKRRRDSKAVVAEDGR